MAQDDFLTFVERVKQAESRGQRFGKDGNLLTSPKGAQGEMQVMPATQRAPGFGVAPVKDNSPDEIARVGRDLLKALDSRYDGNKVYAAAAYNWGPGNVDKWIARGADFNQLPKETQGYLQRIKPETLPSMAKKAPDTGPDPAMMEPPLGISASAKPVQPAPVVAAAPAARSEDLGSGYKAALALSFLGSDDKDRPTTDSELEDRLNETALAEFNKELEDYVPKNALEGLDITALRVPKPVQPVMMSEGGDPGEVLLNRGEEPIGNSAPPRFAAKELDAYIKAANPGVQVLEYINGPGGALGFIHTKLPDLLNVKKGLTPGTKEQTTLHELEHSMDERGGDLMGRPKISKMDNNFRAYNLLNQQWKPVEQFVQSVVQNQDKLKNFFGQDIVSGYITMSPEVLKDLQKRGDDRGLFSEQIASLSALEQVTGKSLTRDPEMRKLFPSTQMMAVYDALTGLRQTRTDARDLPPHTPLPSYTYETNPTMRFIKEKLTGPKEYGIPIKRAGGSPETGEVAPTPEELEAASRPAFLTPKSGIGRKISTKPGEIEGAILQGVSETPYNLLGAPVDLTTMAMRPFGYDVQDPTGGSEWIKKKMSAMGVRPETPTQPTQRAFYELGQLGAGVTNPAAPVRGAAKAAEKAGKAVTAAGMRAEKALEAPVTRVLEGGGRSADMLKALGAPPSFAVKPKGGHFELRPDRPGPGGVVYDDVAETVNAHLATTDDQPLNNWFKTKVASYLRRDMGTEFDPFVKAADAGKKLHLPNEPIDSGMQSSIRMSREMEGFPKSGVAATEYGRNIEEALDASLNIRELGDVAGRMEKRVPPSLMQFSQTNPEMRLYSLDEIGVQGPRLEDLRDRMLKLRKTDEVKFYNEPPVKIPDTYKITDKTLLGITPVQASEKVAQFENWQQEIRQRAASSAIRKNPNISKTDAGNGAVWVNPPDLGRNKNMLQLVQDVGCDGGWCTREEMHSLSYGSGNSRLSILIDGKSRPVAQITIDTIPPNSEKVLKSLSPEELNAFIASNPLFKYAQDTKELASMMETSPQYAKYLDRVPPKMSITEIKGAQNKEDLKDMPNLKKIQDRVKNLDSRFDLKFVDNLEGIGLTEVPRNRPDAILKHFNLPATARFDLKNKFGSETEGFKAILDRAISMNEGSKYFSGNEDEISDIFQNATRAVLQPPVNRARGGMVERQNNDNRVYL